MAGLVFLYIYYEVVFTIAIHFNKMILNGGSLWQSKVQMLWLE